MIKITSINNYCSQEKLVRLAIKVGFFVRRRKGRNHTRVEDKSGRYITGIPRHATIKKPTAEGIIKALIKNGAEIEIIK